VKTPELRRGSDQVSEENFQKLISYTSSGININTGISSVKPIEERSNSFYINGQEDYYRGNQNVQTPVRTGEKQYQHDKCNLSCNECLQEHTREGKLEKSYICCDCGAVFDNFCTLKSHIKQHTEKIFNKCDLCCSQLSKNKPLTEQIKIDIGEKSAKCGSCGNELSSNNRLSSHRKMRTGKRHYQCDVCGTSFCIKYQLSTHTRQHTGENPYRCDVCGKRLKDCEMRS
jgi:KRAB domain-containing zinc finger protein